MYEVVVDLTLSCGAPVSTQRLATSFSLSFTMSMSATHAPLRTSSTAVQPPQAPPPPEKKSSGVYQPCDWGLTTAFDRLKDRQHLSARNLRYSMTFLFYNWLL